MNTVYIGELLEDRHLTVPPEFKKEYKVGDRFKVQATKINYKPEKEGISHEGLELLQLFEKAVDHGGYNKKEITREFIHE